MNDSLTLQTFVIGPRSGGRRYGLLSRSEGLTLTAAEEQFVAGDLAQALGIWADRPEARRSAEFYMCAPFPESGRRFVVRCDYLAGLALGNVASGIGVVLDDADARKMGGRLHRLIALLPRPEINFLTARPLNVYRPAWDDPTSRSGYPTEPSEDLDELLTGARLAVVVADNERPADLLSRILELPDSSHIRSWASTTVLTEVGDFRPDEIFDLTVSGANEPRLGALGKRPTAGVGGGCVQWNDAPPPAAFTLWRRVFGRDDTDRYWRREIAEFEAGRAALSYARDLSADLSNEDAARRFGRWARAVNGLSETIAQPARAALTLAFFERLNAASRTGRGELINWYVADVWPALGRIYPRQPLDIASELGLFDLLTPMNLGVLASDGMFVRGANPRLAKALSAAKMSELALAALLNGAAAQWLNAPVDLDEHAVLLSASTFAAAAERLKAPTDDLTLSKAFVEAWTVLVQEAPMELARMPRHLFSQIVLRLAKLFSDPLFYKQRLATLKALAGVMRRSTAATMAFAKLLEKPERLVPGGPTSFSKTG